jgi:1-acyl-sn-glycerol-3-phosphate acyltransferase
MPITRKNFNSKVSNEFNQKDTDLSESKEKNQVDKANEFANSSINGDEHILNPIEQPGICTTNSKEIENSPRIKAKKREHINNDLNNGKDFKKEVTHDFDTVRYPITFPSLIRCIFNYLVAIPSFIFHICTAYILCFLLTYFPMPDTLRMSFLRSVKAYVSNVLTSIASLWFYKPFYVSIDQNIVDILKNIAQKNENPCCLTLCGHVSEFDWIYMYKLSSKLNLSRYCLFVVKDELSKVPIMGFLMKSVGYTFIKRERKQLYDENRKSIDIVSLNKLSDSLIKEYTSERNIDVPIIGGIYKMIINFLIKLKLVKKNPGSNGLYFPEATIFEKTTYDATLDFYSKNASNTADYPDLFRPNYVLLPRPLGTAGLLSKLTCHLDCIFDITLLVSPYVSSTYNCYSYSDIFACRCEPFTLGILVDNLVIPDQLKKLIGELGEKDLPAFEFPDNLTEKERKIKLEVSSCLNKTYQRKDKIIQKFVEGDVKGNFKDFAEFKKFSDQLSKDSSRVSYPLKLDSFFKIPILAAPFVFTFACFLLFMRFK